MNRLQDLQDKLFLDIQNIIQDLSEINSLETLLQDDFLIKELSEKTAFLKLSQAFDLNDLLKVNDNRPIILEDDTQELEIIKEESNQEILPSEEKIEHFDIEDNQVLAEEHQEETIVEKVPNVELEANLEDVLLIVSDNLDISDNEMFKDDIEEELVIESHSSNVELIPETEEILLEEKLITHSFEEHEESQFSFAMEKPDSAKPGVVEEPKEQFISEISISEHHNTTVDDRINEKEKAFLELESRRKQIIEDNNKPAVSDDNPVIKEQDSKIIDDVNAADKKIKLSNIKGVAKTLFDDEPQDNLHKEQKKSDIGSLLSNNRPTNYMEAAKPKQEFRLDLNDKIAFTQYLFNNSQMDLNHVINRLNSFDNLEDAKEFLSDLYYERNWEKVDRFAQRLWILVENKFL